VRLEKMMALVSEVLQEKEDSPAKGISSETNQSRQTTGVQIRNGKCFHITDFKNIQSDQSKDT